MLTCSLLAGLLVWMAVPACWLLWWYVHPRDVAFGSPFIFPLMKWTFGGLILGTVAGVLVWLKKPCHPENLVLTRTLLIFIVSMWAIFFYSMSRIAAHAGAATGRVLIAVFQESVAMAFIPAALYVVFQIIRH